MRWCGESAAPAIDSGGRLTLTIAGEGPGTRVARTTRGVARRAGRPSPAGSTIARRPICCRARLVLAIPSLWPEPFGLVGLEAAAFGVPAVGFDVGGISTWLTNDVNGRLVSAAAGADGLGDAIAAILRDAEYRARLSCGARGVAQSLYRGRTSRVARARAAVGSMFMMWHLLTGEYPPDCGGVGDYSARLAQELAGAGDTVNVWAPRGESDADERTDSRCRIHRLPDRFGPRSRDALARAWQQQPGIVLLQYVPNALGLKGANLRFCRWLHGMARRGVDVRVMFHEPYFYFSLERPWRNVLAVVQRMMAAELIKASRCVYVSSDSWHARLEPYGRLARAITLPIPSTIPDGADAEDVRRFRALAAPDPSAPLIGHFGTYGDHMAAMIDATFPRVAEHLPRARFAFVGDRSVEFLERLSIGHRGAAQSRVGQRPVVTGRRCCRASSLRSAGAAIPRRRHDPPNLGDGRAGERCADRHHGWRADRSRVARDGAAALAPADDPAHVVDAVRRFIDMPADRAALGRRGQQVYATRFSIERTVETLRERPELEVAAG